MNENRRQKRLPAFLLAPWLEIPLILAVLCLSLLLAGLILKPSFDNYRLRLLARTAAQERSLPAEETAKEELLRLYVELPPSPVPIALSTTGCGWQHDGQRYYYINEYGGFASGLQRIDGRLYYFAPDGTLARAVGVDVSYYDEDIDWRQVAAQGVDFAVIRLGGRGWGAGRLYEDTRAAQYLHNAREAGLQLGVYFYSTACTEAEAAQEARVVLRTLGGTPLELPVFIDVEESGEYPEGRSDLLTREERTRAVESFCRVIEAAGYEAGVYSGHYYFNSALYPQALGERTIWLANYSLARYNRVPSSLDFSIWQFTDAGVVKGIPGYTDLNVIF